MDNSKRESRRRQEDAAFRKIVAWLLAAILYEGLIWLLNRYYIHFTVADVEVAAALSALLEGMQWGGLVLTALSAALWVWLARTGRRTWPGKVALAASLALWITALAALRLGAGGVTMLSVAAPCITALVLIYYLYHLEFCLNAALSGLGILCLWGYRRYFFNHPNATRLAFALAAALLAAVVLLALYLRRHGGKVRGVSLMPAKARYGMTYITCGVAAVSLAGALLLGSTAAYYLIFAVVAWLFCMAVYYTVRLM